MSVDTTRSVDVVVIGMGPGGEEVAGRLAGAGLQVVGIEANLVGGECPYWGCVPSKMMVRAAGLLAESRRVGDLAGSSTTTPDWGRVARRIREEATDNWDDAVAADRFTGQGGILERGQGTITGHDSVSVNGTTYVASRGVVVATGTRAAVPPIAGLAGTAYWTNHEIVETEELPGSLIVLGGGAIGAELAQVMARFGVRVTVVEGLDRLLSNAEPEASRVITEVFGSEGIEVHTGQFAESVSYTDGQFTLRLPDGTELQAEKLLVATGRQTFLRELGVAALGLDADSKFLDVDGHQRVLDGVWAVGDIAGRGMFTHLAVRQGTIAASDILGDEVVPLNLDALPAVTFTDPEVGMVGRTESEAHDAGIDVVTASTPVAESARGWIHGVGNEGLIKLVVDRGRNVVVGATSVGPSGGEVLGLLALAVHAEIPVSTLRSMVYAYPTFHRGIEAALKELP